MQLFASKPLPCVIAVSRTMRSDPHDFRVFTGTSTLLPCFLYVGSTMPTSDVELGPHHQRGPWGPLQWVAGHWIGLGPLEWTGGNWDGLGPSTCTESIYLLSTYLCTYLLLANSANVLCFLDSCSLETVVCELSLMHSEFMI
jgi:hypothetical protein